MSECDECERLKTNVDTLIKALSKERSANLAREHLIGKLKTEIERSNQMKKSKIDSGDEKKAVVDVHLALEELGERVDQLKDVTDRLFSRLECVTTTKGPGAQDTAGIMEASSNCELSVAIRSEGSRVLGIVHLLEKQIVTLEI